MSKLVRFVKNWKIVLLKKENDPLVQLWKIIDA